VVARKTAQVPLQKGVVIWIWFPFPGALTQSPPLLPSSSPQPNSFSLSTLPRITSTTSTISPQPNSFFLYLAPHHFYHFYQLATAELVFSFYLASHHFYPFLTPHPFHSLHQPPGDATPGACFFLRAAPAYHTCRHRVPHVPPPRTTRAATAYHTCRHRLSRRTRRDCAPPPPYLSPPDFS